MFQKVINLICTINFSPFLTDSRVANLYTREVPLNLWNGALIRYLLSMP
ncbi:MAG: hypothetical protein RE471_06295 [Ferroplasma sp.]|nr:hypothetical protein [Ferroplasma sp.]WMT50589.1 MAG: hypothetical protein RE471_06295 [Ferroplasma sp.]